MPAIAAPRSLFTTEPEIFPCLENSENLCPIRMWNDTAVASTPSVPQPTHAFIHDQASQLQWRRGSRLSKFRECWPPLSLDRQRASLYPQKCRPRDQISWCRPRVTLDVGRPASWSRSIVGDGGNSEKCGNLFQADGTRLECGSHCSCARIWWPVSRCYSSCYSALRVLGASCVG